MKTRLSTILLGVAAFALIGVGFALADALDAETKARVERFEKGPATINVSKYPTASRQTTKCFPRNARSATS